MFTALSAAEKQQALARVRMFQGLPARELAALERIATLVRVDKGYTFYHPETTSDVVYILLQGRVDQYRINLNGKKIITTILQPQAFFDATSLLDDGIHHNFAEAMDTLLVLALQHQEFKRLALAYPQMLLHMLAETQGRLLEVEQKLESAAFKGLLGRIAELLLKLAEQQGSNRIVGYTHQEIAEILGTYRETTTQVLNDLRALGYIAIGRKRIDILSVGSLAAAL
jgi:CRP-like cAMP-binding protein